MPATKSRLGVDERYGALSRRPLAILIFLLPLLVYYEVALVTRMPGGLTIKAHDALVRFIELMDMPPTSGLWVGGIAVATILLLWHIFSGDSWRVRPTVPALMAVESVGLAVPLLAIGSLLAGAALMAPSDPIADLGLRERIAISIGAGIYEELVFRMLLISLVHTVACSFLKLDASIGIAAAVILSAIAFAWYHYLPAEGPFPLGRMAFYAIAGLYLALVYVLRGFGIAAGAHAAYDVFATAMVGDAG